MQRVLVTGANGFVGQRVCAALLAQGLQVRGAVRRLEAFESLPDGVDPCLVVRTDDDADWERALNGADTVVHLLARTHVLRETDASPLGAYRRVNVDVTRALLNASARAGVKRFVYMSSIKAVGEGALDSYSENTPCRPVDPYGHTKREAEELVLSSVADGLEPVVLRPPLVYGPGVRGNFLRLMRAVQKGLPLPIGAVRNARSMVFVENLAAAVALSAVHKNATGQIFHVADGDPLSTPSLVTKMGVHLGKVPVMLPVPVSLLRLGGGLLRRSGEVDRLVGSLTVSTEKISIMLGWIPEYSLDQGLQETVRWFRSSARGREG